MHGVKILLNDFLKNTSFLINHDPELSLIRSSSLIWLAYRFVVKSASSSLSPLTSINIFICDSSKSFDFSPYFQLLVILPGGRYIFILFFYSFCLFHDNVVSLLQWGNIGCDADPRVLLLLPQDTVIIIISVCNIHIHVTRCRGLMIVVKVRLQLHYSQGILSLR